MCFEIENANAEKFACKRLNRIGIYKNDETEFQIHQKLRHANVVKLLQVLKTVDHFMLVQELCTTSLQEFLCKRKPLNIVKTQFIAREILVGLNYIHGMNVIHRDIKPANILLKKNAVKICDFGLSIDVADPSPYSALDEDCGTPRYVPPEILNGKNWCFESDIWATGIVITDTQTNYRENESISKRSEQLKTVLDEMFQQNPKCRPNAQQCLEYTFFQPAPKPLDILE